MDISDKLKIQTNKVQDSGSLTKKRPKMGFKNLELFPLLINNQINLITFDSGTKDH